MVEAQRSRVKNKPAEVITRRQKRVQVHKNGHNFASLYRIQTNLTVLKSSLQDGSNELNLKQDPTTRTRRITSLKSEESKVQRPISVLAGRKYSSQCNNNTDTCQGASKGPEVQVWLR